MTASEAMKAKTERMTLAEEVEVKHDCSQGGTMTIAEKMRAQTDFYEGDFYIPEERFYALCDLLGAAEEGGRG